ncbi:MAG: cohesin domain-containing protein [Pseudomonadales bacterium]
MKTQQFFSLIAMVLATSLSKAAVVTTSPAALVISQGSTFTIDLIGTNFNSGDLDGGGINLSFDTSILTATIVTVNTADWEFFSTNGTIDNNAGTINGITFNSFQSRTGDLVFATVEFVAIGSGISTIDLQEHSLNPFASGGTAYANLSLAPGSVTVSTIPVPATAWLLGSALFGLIGVKRIKT